MGAQNEHKGHTIKAGVGKLLSSTALELRQSDTIFAIKVSICCVCFIVSFCYVQRCRQRTLSNIRPFPQNATLHVPLGIHRYEPERLPKQIIKESFHHQIHIHFLIVAPNFLSTLANSTFPFRLVIEISLHLQ